MDGKGKQEMNISLLPQDVLGYILSFLPTKLAASTSVLSSKWRYAFALSQNLEFDDSVFVHPEEGKQHRNVIRESFRKFVDRTLALQGGSPINKFSLRYHLYDDSEMAYACPWICTVVERGVVELEVTLKRPYVPMVPSHNDDGTLRTYGELLLPSELFASRTLVKLTLGEGITLGHLPPASDVSLPALKMLFINSIYFEVEELCTVLLPGCPVLEELFLSHENYPGPPFCICNQTIRILSVDYDSPSQIYIMPGLSFDAPNVVSLDYSDYALSHYTPVYLPSLAKARLDLHYSRKVRRPDISGLITGICNVETLHLTSASADLISRCVKHGLVLPVFNNLVNLSFGSNNKRGWKLLPYLLEQSPKLETLIIQDLDGCTYTGHVPMPLNQVKVLHILGYRGTAQVLKKFLVGMDSLELFQVDLVVEEDEDDIILQTKRDLVMMLRGVSPSSNCHIRAKCFV